MPFYFCLTNDPDHGLLSDYASIFKELTRNRIFTTTAVFCNLKNDGSFLSSHCNVKDTDTLQNINYQKLMLLARDEGHEIAFHGYSQVSDTRDEFQKGLEYYKKVFGEYPSVYIEHGGHPGKHKMERCKKENIAYMGSEPESKYYIKDIVSSVFKCVWSHEFLLDNVTTPLNLKEIFQYKDGILYFKRWRNRDIIPLFPKLTLENNTIIGYTHFGYSGYKSKKERYFFFSKQKYPLENWTRGDTKGTTRILSEFLQENNVTSLTINQLHSLLNEA